jgi:hypothetical protein
MERIVEIKNGKLVVTCFNPLTVELRNVTLKIEEEMTLKRKKRRRRRRRQRQVWRGNLRESRSEKKPENKNEFHGEYPVVKKEMKKEII